MVSPCSTLLRLRKKLPRRVDHARPNIVERTGNERAGRLGVAAAAELPRERVHVDVARAAKRDLDLAVPEIAEEERHARAGDRPRVLDDPVEVLLTYIILL